MSYIIGYPVYSRETWPSAAGVTTINKPRKTRRGIYESI
nr:MAG TPA: hypothetical protein [Caudoviricetes sp.]